MTLDETPSGRDAMKQIAANNKAVLIVQERETDKGYMVHGKLNVTENGYAFERSPGDYQLIGSGGENGWSVVSRDPWIVGLRTPSRNQMIAEREPAEGEYDEWLQTFEQEVRQ